MKKVAKGPMTQSIEIYKDTNLNEYDVYINRSWNRIDEYKCIEVLVGTDEQTAEETAIELARQKHCKLIRTGDNSSGRLKNCI